MQIIGIPKAFNGMLEDNLFGKNCSDFSEAVSGFLVMLPSASLRSINVDACMSALDDPSHGSARDIASQNVANLVGAILSLALALELSFNNRDGANLLRRKIRGVSSAG